ncbi:helix-turn-helix protein [Tamaricihabitans halophyticus]|uniref:Helix-turn-helix protein n=1 Tax=Tamaricihabitans halophyticus TaxID=1262583 RepID=A0A4R2R0M7_9PSEU|nr:helix-turn-helix transcriptional regulator [Tamaricihabitans halophyticus]TCP56190.1 helix-turn-helix protein [Tamaricihabitans halophyticus]
MPVHPSDARRRELGAELRKYREAAGLLAVELAHRVGWSASHVSRLESGYATANEVTVATYLAYCSVPSKEVRKVLRTARSNEAGYLVRRNVLRTLVLHENLAHSITGTAPLLIPGLLQTREYARAVIELPGNRTEADVDERLATRMDRQELLTRLRGPRCAFYIYEAALRCKIGTDRVMNEQLLHLALLGAQRGITLRVVPFSAGGLAANSAEFTLMDFPEHAPVLHMENMVSGLFVENPEDVAVAHSVIGRLAEDALDEGQSREWFVRLANDYDRPPEGAV